MARQRQCPYVGWKASSFELAVQGSPKFIVNAHPLAILPQGAVALGRFCLPGGPEIEVTGDFQPPVARVDSDSARQSLARVARLEIFKAKLKWTVLWVRMGSVIGPNATPASSVARMETSPLLSE